MKTIKISIALLLLTALLINSMPLQAQGDQERETKDRHRKEMSEKIKTSKIAVITEQVKLTPEEAEKFWPVYNEMEAKKEDITHKLMNRFRGKEERPEPTDDEALEIMKQRLTLEENLLDLKAEYQEKFLDILSPVKVLKLYEAEDKFRRQLMERFRGREKAPDAKGVAPPHRGRARNK